MEIHRLNWREFFEDIKGKKVKGGEFKTINHSGSYFIKEEFSDYISYALMRYEEVVFEVFFEKGGEMNFNLGDKVRVKSSVVKYDGLEPFQITEVKEGVVTMCVVFDDGSIVPLSKIIMFDSMEVLNEK